MDDGLEGHVKDEAGAPVIERVSSKIAALERRAEYLEDQLAEWRGSPGGKGFARAELSALRAGIAALRYHLAEVEGLDQPLLALQGLLDAVPESIRYSESGLAGACRRAKELLEEWA